MSFSRRMAQWRSLTPSRRRAVLLGIAILIVALLLGREFYARAVNGDSGDRSARAGGAGAEQLPAVDVVLAQAGMLREELEYTGTTRPTQEITVRARTEGRLLTMGLDVGDRVRSGQVIGHVDESLLKTAVREAEAELASRISEAAAARTRVGDAQTQVQQARLDLFQKEADYKRIRRLWEQGYEARQNAERALTASRLARQVLRSTEQQVRNATASVRAAEAQVSVQRAVIAQERERLSYTTLKSPINGAITARFVQEGDLLQPGADVVRIGDLRQVQVDVSVSELEMGQVRVGSAVRVRFDALGDLELAARVERISPQADPVSRLVPITISLPNDDRRIGAGMLARVRFGSSAPTQVLIPESALQVGPRRSRSEGSTSARGAAGSPTTDGASKDTGTVFVIRDTAESPTGDSAARPVTAREYVVHAREVRLGDRADGRVVVREGIQAGEPIVSRSSGPLKEGARVRPSILSEEALNGAAGAGQAEVAPPVKSDGVPSGGNAPRGSGPPSSGDPGRPAPRVSGQGGRGSGGPGVTGRTPGSLRPPAIGQEYTAPNSTADAPATGGASPSSRPFGISQPGSGSFGNTGRGTVGGSTFGSRQGLSGSGGTFSSPGARTSGRSGFGGSGTGSLGSGTSTRSGIGTRSSGFGNFGGFGSTTGPGSGTGGAGTGAGR